MCKTWKCQHKSSLDLDLRAETYCQEALESGTQCYPLEDDLQNRLEMCCECVREHVRSDKDWPANIQLFQNEFAEVDESSFSPDDTEQAKATYAVPRDRIGSTPTLQMRDILRTEGRKEA